MGQGAIFVKEWEDLLLRSLDNRTVRVLHCRSHVVLWVIQRHYVGKIFSRFVINSRVGMSGNLNLSSKFI